MKNEGNKMRKLYHDGHAIKGLEVIQRSRPFGNDARCGLGDVAHTLAEVAKRAPNKDDWLHIKRYFDGYGTRRDQATIEAVA
jgi:hypothetical protein